MYRVPLRLRVSRTGFGQAPHLDHDVSATIARVAALFLVDAAPAERRRCGWCGTRPAARPDVRLPRLHPDTCRGIAGLFVPDEEVPELDSRSVDVIRRIMAMAGDPAGTATTPAA